MAGPGPISATRRAARAAAAAPLLLVGFVLLTALLVWSASHLKVDAGFNKMVPLKHPYMQVFTATTRRRSAAPTAWRSPSSRQDGDIFNKEYMEKLKALTDDVFL